MTVPRWDRRFFDSTRGRIVVLVRYDAQTVEELASSLGLSDNAVRVHLAALERDGLVEQRGVRRGGVGKPSFIYSLSEDGERLFPKFYAPILGYVLSAVARTSSRKDADRLLRAAAEAYLANRERSGARDPIHEAVALLSELGGIVETEEQDDPHTRVLIGRSCPLAIVAEEEPLACELLGRMIEGVVATEVRVKCTPPHCRFEVRRPA